MRVKHSVQEIAAALAGAASAIEQTAVGDSLFIIKLNMLKSKDTVGLPSVSNGIPCHCVTPSLPPCAGGAQAAAGRLAPPPAGHPGERGGGRQGAAARRGAVQRRRAG